MLYGEFTNYLIIVLLTSSLDLVTELLDFKLSNKFLGPIIGFSHSKGRKKSLYRCSTGYEELAI